MELPVMEFKPFDGEWIGIHLVLAQVLWAGRRHRRSALGWRSVVNDKSERTASAGVKVKFLRGTNKGLGVFHRDPG